MAGGVGGKDGARSPECNEDCALQEVGAARRRLVRSLVAGGWVRGRLFFGGG